MKKTIYTVKWLIALALLTTVFSANALTAQDTEGLNRLLHRALLIPQSGSANSNAANSATVTHADAPIESSQVNQASYQPPVSMVKSRGQDAPTNPFPKRRAQRLDPNNFIIPVPATRSAYDKLLNKRREEPTQESRGEYIYDGNDRGERISVDESWNVYGLDTEDTIGHFDTVDGRRLVSPSNRVAIYAPRFGAVRKVNGLGRNVVTTRPTSAERRTPLQMAARSSTSIASNQNTPTVNYAGRSQASSFKDRTRGLTADNTTHLYGLRNLFKPFENLQLIRLGRYSSAENTRLEMGLQSANVWRDDLGLQVSASKAQPVIVNDVYRVQQIEQIKTEGDNAILRVVKIASKKSGRPGDEIEFTIRYDNISSKTIGNVTIIDNLTSRLEYIPDSAQSSLHADFITEPNSKGSLILKWEIQDPLEPGTGGIVRFKCRIR